MTVTMPSVAVVEITRRCQNNCYHCYVYRYDGDVLKIYDKKSEMNRKKAFRLIEALAEAGIKEFQPLGGEPTLHKDLFTIAGYAEDQGLSVTTTTNAIRLAEKGYARSFTDVFSGFTATLHSHIPEVHNRIVQNNAFDKTLTGIKNALREGATITINSALCRHNNKSYAETIEFLAGLDIEKINLNLSTPPSKKVERLNWHLSMKEYAECFLDLMSLAREHGIRLTSTCSWKLCIFNPIPFGIGHYPCSIGSCLVQIDTWGNVLPCYYFRERIGNLFRQELEKIWQCSTMEYYRNRQYLPDLFPDCMQCNLLSLCGAPCLVGRTQVERDIMPVKSR